MRESTTLLCSMFAALGVFCAIVNFMQNYSFNVLGERMTSKLRKYFFFVLLFFCEPRFLLREVYQSLLLQEIAYFDMDENNVGALTTKLATQPTYIHGLFSPIFYRY